MILPGPGAEFPSLPSFDGVFPDDPDSDASSDAIAKFEVAVDEYAQAAKAHKEEREEVSESRRKAVEEWRKRVESASIGKQKVVEKVAERPKRLRIRSPTPMDDEEFRPRSDADKDKDDKEDEDKDEEEEEEEAEKFCTPCRRCRDRGTECLRQSKANTRTCEGCHLAKVKCDWGQRGNGGSDGERDRLIIWLLRKQLEDINDLDWKVVVLGRRIGVVQKQLKTLLNSDSTDATETRPGPSH
ncbi:hypothetical protein D9757_014023 [Collybiopsis confluens]|uniref:Zn(2)-C6 fungal-type domain-containing protein n=1 Tax=Collybiopsis confluens TaxID=2823264 RepID=A0A8H5FQQ5_9AGAR|nr:hypothetical protein D9757_014023 [Collybiopsis confluens]